MNSLEDFGHMLYTYIDDVSWTWFWISSWSCLHVIALIHGRSLWMHGWMHMYMGCVQHYIHSLLFFLHSMPLLVIRVLHLTLNFAPPPPMPGHSLHGVILWSHPCLDGGREMGLLFDRNIRLCNQDALWCKLLEKCAWWQNEWGTQIRVLRKHYQRCPMLCGIH